jgi:P27 family predicted phage terminase small subunit
MPAPKKPSHMKVIAGTDRADRRPKQRVGDRLLSSPPPPKYLSRGAKTQWRRVVPAIFRLGVLTEADVTALALLSETLATAEEARVIVDREGFAVSTADGGAKPHPAARIMETARSQVLQLFDRFGLSPRARQSVDVNPDRAAPNKFAVNRGPAQ